MPKEVPHEYSKPDGEAIVDVDLDTYKNIKESNFGIRLHRSEQQKLGI